MRARRRWSDFGDSVCALRRLRRRAVRGERAARRRSHAAGEGGSDPPEVGGGPGGVGLPEAAGMSARRHVRPTAASSLRQILGLEPQSDKISYIKIQKYTIMQIEQLNVRNYFSEKGCYRLRGLMPPERRLSPAGKLESPEHGAWLPEQAVLPERAHAARMGSSTPDESRVERGTVPFAEATPTSLRFPAASAGRPGIGR